MSWRNLPWCNACYGRKHPEYVPRRLATHLTVVETCCNCGVNTTSGIYLRTDTTTVTHAPEETA